MVNGEELQPGQIPVDAVDPDQLPRERGLSYDEIARIVGSLYLDSHIRIRTVETQLGSVMQQLKNTVEQLQLENVRLKREISARQPS